MILLRDDPENAAWLAADEREALLDALERERVSRPQRTSWPPCVIGEFGC